MAKEKATEAKLATFDPELADKLADELAAAERTATLSTRLSQEQRALIEEAAQLQSWTPSNLLRKAAVERSVHILNTGRPTRFNFGLFAERLASQLCDPELWVDGEDGREIIDWEIYDEERQVNVGSLTQRELYQLRDALHLGGLEFMDEVVGACQRRISPTGLPEPIDPSVVE